MSQDPEKWASRLPENEWAFHKVPDSELRNCAAWELSRLAGAKGRPWLDLSQEEKRLNNAENVSTFQQVPPWYGDFLKNFLLKVPQMEQPLPVEVVSFVLDYREAEPALIKSFRNWLRNSENRKKWYVAASLPPHRPRSRAILAGIVVFRAANAGLSRAQAIKVTGPLWKAWKLDLSEAGILSAPHWSRALARIKTLRAKVMAEAARLSCQFGEGA